MDIAARLLNGLIMMALPFILGIYLARRTRQRWSLFLAGAVVFIAAQVLHIPFNQVVLNPILEQLGFGDAELGSVLLFGALLLGLSAGVFEETARYLGLRFWKRQARSWEAALMYGAGHGGIESLLLGLVAILFFVQALAFQQGVLQSLVPTGQLEVVEAQFDAYWEIPWPVALLGAVERVFALALQLSLSVMVMRVFTHDNRWWLAVAIGWHAVVDAVTVVGVAQVGAVATEAIIGVMGLFSVAIIFLLRETSAKTPESDTGPPEAVDLPPVEPTDEKLEDSHYSE